MWFTIGPGVVGDGEDYSGRVPVVGSICFFWCWVYVHARLFRNECEGFKCIGVWSTPGVLFWSHMVSRCGERRSPRWFGGSSAAGNFGGFIEDRSR